MPGGTKKWNTTKRADLSAGQKTVGITAARIMEAKKRHRDLADRGYPGRRAVKSFFLRMTKEDSYRPESTEASGTPPKGVATAAQEASGTSPKGVATAAQEATGTPPKGAATAAPEATETLPKDAATAAQEATETLPKGAATAAQETTETPPKGAATAAQEATETLPKDAATAAQEATETLPKDAATEKAEDIRLTGREKHMETGKILPRRINLGPRNRPGLSPRHRKQTTPPTASTK